MPKSATVEAKKKFTALHEGLPPSKVTTRKAPRTTKYGVEMGKVEAIEYRKKRPCKPGSKKACDRSYRHDFDKDSEPKLWHDDQGELHVDGDKYTVTEHGIVDTHGKKKRSKTSRGKMKYVNGPENPFINVRDVGGARRAENRAENLADQFVFGLHTSDLKVWAATMATVGSTAAAVTLGAALISKHIPVADGTKAVVLGVGGLFGSIALAGKMPRIAAGIGIAGIVTGVMLSAGAVRSRSQRDQLGDEWRGLQNNPQQNSLGAGAQVAADPSSFVTPNGSTRSTGTIY